jgi:hypothetical protein
MNTCNRQLRVSKFAHNVICLSVCAANHNEKRVRVGIGKSVIAENYLLC